MRQILGEVLMRQLVVIIAALLGAWSTTAMAQTSTVENGGDREKFIGTFQLIMTEVKDINGTWREEQNFNRFGYITYSDTGYMSVATMDRNRVVLAGNQPTPEEAQKALQGYRGYYGPYTVNEAEQFVVHHRAGQITPGGEVDAKRFFDFVGNRLILTPAPASGVKEEATRHIVWERVPEVTLSAEAKRLVGFRRLLYTERYTEQNGSIVKQEQRDERWTGSYIIYTPTGHMMAHLMDKDGRIPYAGDIPTPEEALAAYRSYYGYFGRFTIYENEEPQYVVHNQEGTLNPGRDMDVQRFYQFRGNVLRLGAATQTSNGETTGLHLYWERLPPR